MPPLLLLDPSAVREVFGVFHQALLDRREAINRLNVYPVPDEDTGTNLSLTVQSVVDHLSDAHRRDEVYDALIRGSLMGARGASGVILAQYLRGLAGELRTAAGADGPLLAAGLAAGAASAVKAVLTPVEGTILTVARDAGEAAVAAAGQGADLTGVLAASRAAAAATLARTPDMLAELARAGVVDAGGTGLLLLLDSLLNVVAGIPLPAEGGPPPRRDRELAGADDKRFELVLSLQAGDAAQRRLREVWGGLGNDSTLVAGGDGTWVCHLHTDQLERALQAARAAGNVISIRITDLFEQVELLRHAQERPEVATGLVAVASGPGLENRFRTAGAVLVHGGRSMNPSTELLLTAVEASGTRAVVLLPNDENIIPVAEQVPAFAGAEVLVVPSRSIPQGLAALTVYSPGDPPDANRTRMADAVAGVRGGEVTRAVRSASSDRGTIRAGDWLGFVEGALVVIAATMGEALASVLADLVLPATGLVMIVEGEGADPAETAGAVDGVAASWPDVEVEVLAGGQPHYPYLIGARARG